MVPVGAWVTKVGFEKWGEKKILLTLVCTFSIRQTGLKEYHLKKIYEKSVLIL